MAELNWEKNGFTKKKFGRIDSRGCIFSQAGNELGASLFPAWKELSMHYPYTSFPAGNELILKLTKNTASGYKTEVSDFRALSNCVISV
jgi:hypothetical protein